MVPPVQPWHVLFVANWAGSFANLIGGHDDCFVVKKMNSLPARRNL
jgi:hypothetical protein